MSERRVDARSRRALREALLEVAPWLGASEVGPRAVDAGTCQRCMTRPRLLPTCGPAGDAGVCRDCADDLGDDGWCAGHQADGRAARSWAAGLPDDWARYVLAWWIATGEVRYDPATIDPASLPASVRAALPGGRADRDPLAGQPPP